MAGNDLGCVKTPEGSRQPKEESTPI